MSKEEAVRSFEQLLLHQSASYCQGNQRGVSVSGRRRRFRPFAELYNLKDLKINSLWGCAAGASVAGGFGFNRSRRACGRAPRATLAGALGSPRHRLDALFCVSRLRPSSARAGRCAERAQWAADDVCRAARESARGGRGRGRVRWRARARTGRLRLGAWHPPRACDAAPAPRRWRRRLGLASDPARHWLFKRPNFEKCPLRRRRHDQVAHAGA